MKKILSIVALMLLTVFTAVGQCGVTIPTCTTPIVVNETLSGLSLTGSQCFTGLGDIIGNVNVNNWDFLKFSATPSTADTDYLKMDLAINFAFGKSVYVTSGTVYLITLWQVGGNNSYVNDGATLRVLSMSSNNSLSPNQNRIVLGTGSHFFYGVPQVEYFPGDTIHTSTNITNDLYIVDCSNALTVPLNVEFLSFKYINKQLTWEVNTKGELTELQYVKDAGKNDWQTVYSNRETSGSYTPSEGFYRLRVDNRTISYIVPVKIEKAVPSKGVKIDLKTRKPVTNPKPYEPYIQDHKMHEIVN